MPAEKHLSRSISVLVACLVFVVSCASNNGGSRAREVQVRYGKVVNIQRIPVPSAVPAGAIVGGFTGLVIAHRSSPGRQLASGVAGAALGGLAANAMGNDRRSYQYRLRFKDGSDTQYITENGFFRVDDCIAVERGDYNNLRRVADVLCEGVNAIDPIAKSVIEASQCHDAKVQLLDADTDTDVKLASHKVKVLCQF